MADPHHNDAHDAYVRGSMEISEQASTYDLFKALAKWGSLWICALLAFLTIWFMPAGSFIGGAIAFLVMVAAGWWFLKSPKKAH